MTQESRDLIQAQMNCLIGARGFTIGRSAAMCWIEFEHGDVKYALHIQCAFRICSGEKVLTANLDMFEPTEEIEGAPSFDWETYDWDVQGFNLFDKWTGEWKKNGQEVKVETVEVGDFGDLTIRFSNGMFLGVFLNGSATECWRFFERDSDAEHLVVTADGIEK